MSAPLALARLGPADVARALKKHCPEAASHLRWLARQADAARGAGLAASDAERATAEEHAAARQELARLRDSYAGQGRRLPADLWQFASQPFEQP